MTLHLSFQTHLACHPAFQDGFPDLKALSNLLRGREVKSMDLVDLCLQRIAERDPLLHAFTTVYEREARLAASSADTLMDAGIWLGPLHGVPVALKDNFDIAGKATTAGSPSMLDNIASKSSWVVERLHATGAIIVGKLHMVQFALGAWGTNEQMGAPRNPWGGAVHMTPGGSSSGAAVAVAGGLVPLSVGTDTGGSVRMPASLCGVTGFKPTIGRLRLDGVVPLSETLDSAGVFAQSASDAALFYATLASDDRTASAVQHGRRTAQGLRIGYLPQQHLSDVQPDVLAAYREAIRVLAAAGASLVEIPLERSLDDFAEVGALIMLAEGALHWGELAADTSREMDPAVRSRFMGGKGISAVQYIAAQRRQCELKREFSELLRHIDVLITPGTPWAALPLEGLDQSRLPVRYTRIVNLLDMSGVCVQAGFDQRGLPIGLQIAGAGGTDAQVAEVAMLWQDITTWHQQRWTPTT